ncbi:hypothetical protein Q3G72_014255 [Acer saccharum]|nr:hypothetical protein Q3G72_014255 [Acer saccharum]
MGYDASFSSIGSFSDGFLKHEAVKLPDTNVREGGTRGCLLWFSDLLDIRELAANGQDLYVRVAASELEQLSEKKRVIIIVTCVVSAMGVLVLGWIIFMCKRKLRIQGKMDNSRDINDNNEESKTDEMELLIYDLNTIANATDNYADKKKLGEGGFGCVYKGTLMEGQEIAIKRLSKCSGQGIDEFKNELRHSEEIKLREKQVELLEHMDICLQKDFATLTTIIIFLVMHGDSGMIKGLWN